MTGGRFLRWTETLLWWSGALLLGWCAATLAEARLYQVFAGRSLERLRHSRPAERSVTPSIAGGSTARPEAGSAQQKTPPREPPLPPGGLIGRLELARLGLSAILLEGDDSRSLKLGIGHIPGTPFPWDNGNAAFAGHRDTFLRSLRHVRDGDRLDLETPRETYHYVVDSIQIVSPDDVSVLGPTGFPSLTLVTCYPFYFVGSAPKRFVVRARRVEG